MPVLNKVVDGLAPETWTKGTLEKVSEVGCKRCLLGWVSYAITDNASSSSSKVEDTKAARVVAETIRRMFPERARNDEMTRVAIMVAFNDHKDTTFEDVRRVVEKAAWREPILWE